MAEENRNILEGLNSEQEKAVRQIDGASLILAGAGSGKTRVLTCKIAMIIASGCAPWEILALTFTKKAANEMKERISQMVGEHKARYIKMGTFHSLFARFLRKYADRLGYPEQFTIYDAADSRSVIRQCIGELGLDEKIYRPNAVLSRISAAKNGLMTVGAYRNNSNCIAEDRLSRHERIVDIYDLYTKKCKAAGAMDFDDLLLNTNILLRDHPDALEQISSQFRYILVDEYQDTNFAQLRILLKLAAAHGNITVVGDDSQSIYAFRGARIKNILDFGKDFPDASIFRLEQNYRSSQTIVNAANSLIVKNKDRLKKTCFSESEKGEKIHLLNAATDQEEGYMIAASILERIYADKSAYKDFAVLYRTNGQSRVIEEALRKRNLPYKVFAGLSFFDRAEIRDMIAYFRLCINPLDNEAFRRIVNVPTRKIGDITIRHLADVASANGCSLLDAVLLEDDVLARFDLKGSVVSRLKEFVGMIGECNAICGKTDAYTMATHILNSSGYWGFLQEDTSFSGKCRLENVESLINGIKSYCDDETERRLRENEAYSVEDVVVTLSEYVENLTLLSDVERETESMEEDSNNKIALMTIHSSKGLEFPHVYVAGMEENLFPSENDKDMAALEEERRLFYVAITRAKRSVTLSFAKSRMKWGKQVSNNVSRFVRDIDPEYLDGMLPADGFSGLEANASVTKSLAAQSVRKPVRTTEVRSGRPKEDFKIGTMLDLKEGQTVEHDHFGQGKILSIDNDVNLKKAQIRFENGEIKTIALKFARLVILSD